MVDWLDDRSRVEKEIAGQLKSAIDAHGPITNVTRASAARRIYCLLKALRQQAGSTAAPKKGRKKSVYWWKCQACGTPFPRSKTTEPRTCPLCRDPGAKTFLRIEVLRG